MSHGLETQVEALKEVQSSGKAAEMRNAVLGVITADGGLTCREIGKVLGIEPHVVSARISELEKDGKVKKDGTKACSVSGRTVTAYSAGQGYSMAGTRINMQMGVSLNPKTNLWVIYFDGKIIGNAQRFKEAGEILKEAYTSQKGL